MLGSLHVKRVQSFFTYLFPVIPRPVDLSHILHQLILLQIEDRNISFITWKPSHKSDHLHYSSHVHSEMGAGQLLIALKKLILQGLYTATESWFPICVLFLS